MAQNTQAHAGISTSAADGQPHARRAGDCFFYSWRSWSPPALRVLCRTGAPLDYVNIPYVLRDDAAQRRGDTSCDGPTWPGADRACCSTMWPESGEETGHNACLHDKGCFLEPAPGQRSVTVRSYAYEQNSSRLGVSCRSSLLQGSSGTLRTAKMHAYWRTIKYETQSSIGFKQGPPYCRPTAWGWTAHTYFLASKHNTGLRDSTSKSQ